MSNSTHFRVPWAWRLMLGCLLSMAPASFASDTAGTNAPNEMRFETLTVGTNTYTNVVVTSKTTNRVMVLHSRGVATFKVENLDPEVREHLGFKPPPPEKDAREKLMAGLEKVPGFKVEQMQEMQAQVTQTNDKVREFLQGQGTDFFILLLAGVVVIYAFGCFCLMLICRHAGQPAGVFAWIPGLQMVAMLRAAKMSLAWFGSLLLVGAICGGLAPYYPEYAALVGAVCAPIALAFSLIWPFKIAKACQKGIGTAIALILPVTSPFAFLYLAFAGGGEGGGNDGGASTAALRPARVR